VRLPVSTPHCIWPISETRAPRVIPLRAVWYSSRLV
jgi:hypothetical protein